MKLIIQSSLHSGSIIAYNSDKGLFVQLFLNSKFHSANKIRSTP